MFKTVKLVLLNTLNFLKVPELNLPEDAILEFERMYENLLEKGNVDYKSKYPKYLFFNYIIENKGVLVHGSNHPNIEVFEPREQTLYNGKPAKAVFAASDGIWSLFFATVERKNYQGSLRNMCMTIPTKKGIKRYYYFSLNKEYRGNLWCNGIMYILPKEKFKQGGIKDEWICEEEVKPLAKISVSPEDFPFLNQVKRHDESDSIIKTLFKVLILNK